MASRVRVEYPGAIYHVTCRMLGDTVVCLEMKQIIRSRKLIAENSELRSRVEKCEKRLNELRVTEQQLKA